MRDDTGLRDQALLDCIADHIIIIIIVINIIRNIRRSNVNPTMSYTYRHIHSRP